MSIKLFYEILRILSNTPGYVICLEFGLFISVIWLIVFHRTTNQRKRFSKEEEDSIISNYIPECLVGEIKDVSVLKTRIVDGKVGKYISINDKKCLNLATHNYLGLLEKDEILDKAISSLKKYGVGSCGPRGFYGTLDVHLELEEYIAKFMKAEEAVVYSYGFSTIASAIPAYSKRNDIIFVDEKVNFAIQKGLEASRSTIYFYKHNDMDDLENLLLQQKVKNDRNPKKAARTRSFIVAEGIYMNTGEICPLPEVVALRKKYGLRLFLDESISFGAIGKTGRGLTEYFGVDPSEVDLICGSMEWAMGSIGGFCVGSHFIIEHQRLSGLGYCFSASLPPLLTEAAITALKLFETNTEMFSDLEKVCKKVHKELLRLENFSLIGNEISPVKHLHIRNDKLTLEEKQLILEQIVEKCISYNLAVIDAKYLFEKEMKHLEPSLRLTVNCILTDEEIIYFINVLEKVSKIIIV